MSRIFSASTIWKTIASLALLQVAVHAADSEAAKEEQRNKAAECVVSALSAEANGDLVARQRLLAEALLAVDFAPAQWQLGKLRDGDGEWTDIKSSIDTISADKAIAEYERRRAMLPDTFNSHVVLATYCQSAGLNDQCRAHLTRALEFEPDNTRIRQALGYRNMGGEWMSPEQVAELGARVDAATKSIQTYGKELTAIAKKLAVADRKSQESGLEQLNAINGTDAVPAVEYVLATTFPALAGHAVTWLGSIDSVESSQSLLRISLTHQSVLVRNAAADELKKRPLHDFVPDMLQMLASPVNMMAVPQFDQRGSLIGYRQAYSQEKVDKIDIALLDQNFLRTRVRLPANGEGGREGRREALARTADLTRQVEKSLIDTAVQDTTMKSLAVRRVNLATKDRNARIAEVLSRVTEEEFSEDPAPMWKWWDKYNETKYQDYKPERYVRTALSNRVPRYEVAGATPECFVAGTPVVTTRGMKPIESVNVGDRVLSRNIESGELSWKPVLRATTRPAEPTYAIEVGSEQFQCTGGHLFWVSGGGWKKASELKVADILHAAEEPQVVSGIKQSESAPTFNLQVADTGTYFVGKAMILTHDVTPRSNNRQVVPGLTTVQ